MVYQGSHGLHKALEKAGFSLPDHCQNVRLLMSFDDHVVLQFDVLLTPKHMQKLGEALKIMGAEEAMLFNPGEVLS